MNNKIKAYLKQKHPEYFEGVDLYKAFDFDAKLHSQFITKGATDQNKHLLKTELERLEKIDPKLIAEKRQKIADAAAAEQEQLDKEADEQAQAEADEAEELAKRKEQEAIDLAAKSFSVEEIAEVKQLTKSVPELSTKVDEAIESFNKMSEDIENLKKLPAKVEALEKLIKKPKK